VALKLLLSFVGSSIKFTYSYMYYPTVMRLPMVGFHHLDRSNSSNLQSSHESCRPWKFAIASYGVQHDTYVLSTCPVLATRIWKLFPRLNFTFYKTFSTSINKCSTSMANPITLLMVALQLGQHSEHMVNWHWAQVEVHLQGPRAIFSPSSV